jgi:hypothetical protein
MWTEAISVYFKVLPTQCLYEGAQHFHEHPPSRWPVKCSLPMLALPDERIFYPLQFDIRFNNAEGRNHSYFKT